MSESATLETAVLHYAIDTTHSQIGFKVRHLGFSKVRGRFVTFSGTVDMAADSLHTLQASATIETASIDTSDKQRDAHLKSGDFFDAETYPEMTFRSTGVRNAAVNSFLLDGDLTLHGVTLPVVLEGTYLGGAKDPWGNDRVAFEAVTRINRKDFGLVWNQVMEAGGLLVGEEVEITLELQAVLQK